MTDQVLTSALREWRQTPAPETPEERVFRPRPVPVPWWRCIPAGPVAALGYRPRLVNGEASESITDVSVYFGPRPAMAKPAKR
jgi:hypothetical protein